MRRLIRWGDGLGMDKRESRGEEGEELGGDGGIKRDDDDGDAEDEEDTSAVTTPLPKTGARNGSPDDAGWTLWAATAISADSC